MALELVPQAATIVERSRAWSTLTPDEARRRAVEAARDRRLVALWSLTEWWLLTWGRSGARVSPNTLEAYRIAVADYLRGAGGVSLLDPPLGFGASWVRSMEGEGLKPSTVGQKLAGARALYAALRGIGATGADPFCDVKVAKDPTPPWERRHPYPTEHVERLLERAKPRDAALVLLGAHAGLRVAEACALVGEDLELEAGRLRVRSGKGGKARTVALSRRLRAALEALETPAGDEVLALSPQGARAALKRLCGRAGVPYLASHPLRHASGTRLYRETGDLETVARHLGHSSLETSRVYAKWSDERLKKTLEDW